MSRKAKKTETFDQALDQTIACARRLIVSALRSASARMAFKRDAHKLAQRWLALATEHHNAFAAYLRASGRTPDEQKAAWFAPVEGLGFSCDPLLLAVSKGMTCSYFLSHTPDAYLQAEAKKRARVDATKPRPPQDTRRGCANCRRLRAENRRLVAENKKLYRLLGHPRRRAPKAA